MYWQREVFRSSATWARGGAYRQELPDAGLLGGILIHVSGTPVTDSMIATEKWRIKDFITELKIVGNGNRTIHAVTGPVLHAVNFLDGGSSLLDKAHNYGSSTLHYHAFVPFGRGIFDQQYGLDLGAWDSVEMLFVNDASSTYFSADWTITSILYWLREASPGQFIGYRSIEEYRKWTTVSDEWVYLDLPTEHRLRRLMLQVLADVDENNLAKTTPYNVAYEIKLKLRSGAVEVYNGNLRDLWYDNALYLGRDPIVGIEPYTSDGKGIHTGLGQVLAMGGVRLPHGGVQNTYGTSMVPGHDGQTLEREVPTDAEQDALILSGLAYENVAFFPFDFNGDPNSYLDLRAEGTVKLDVHTRSGAAYAGGTIRVILDKMIQGQGPVG
ncbi:MAG: hypothetical protein K6T81_20385 [Alicyclobacillus macrosporangiidus]|uniref:hypothetical protein n=1 Tax=Alicyclobacillus macrosporangiidus TaxID=392015 RepID=UPI0026F307B9|nr:hypothetical protein [Alicyclobacillus macrosporangiidus]MCL6601068.1 hypothetical protein [Alicyclobacillus macrosporangiidus]